MDAAGVHKVRALLFIEVLEIRNVLEVVCVKLAAFDDVVRLHIVLELLDLQRPALGLEDGLGLREDLGVRRGAGGDGDGALALGGFGRGFRRSGFGGSSGFGLGCAGGERQAQYKSQSQRNDFFELFHEIYSFDSEKKFHFMEGI